MPRLYGVKFCFWNLSPVDIMKRSNRRRLFNLFAFALLAFAIYLTLFYKEEDGGMQAAPASKNTTTKMDAVPHH